MSAWLFSGGSIRTGSGAEADWVLVEGEVVAAVGTGDPPQADRAVDMDGAVLVPALRDGHVHLPATGLYARGMDFRNVRSSAQILAAFEERAASSDILFGGNFEEPLDASLTRHELDARVGRRPALLARADMHSCIVSTALIDRLDLSDLEGVDRDERGPTGYLREKAASEAWKWFDASLTPQQQRDAVLTAVQLAYSKGVAEVHEMFVVEWRGWDSAGRFLETIEDVALTVVPYLATDEVKRVQDMGLPRLGGDWFLDGSFGSHTAWMREGYVSAPPEGTPANGISYRSDDDLYDLFRDAQERDMQVGVHAIGDAAIDQALRTWQRVADELGQETVRKTGHRIEHFECAGDEHIEAAARLGIKGSIQPAFDRYWGGTGGLYADRIGWDRARTMNRFKTMAANGVQLGGGSDSTVTPLDPFLQLAALRAHHVPGESMAAADAFTTMTSGVAALEPRVGRRGEIAEGAWADLAVLDRDPLTVDPDALLETEVLGTWVRGRRVWPESEASAR